MSVNVDLAYNDLITNLRLISWPIGLYVAPVSSSKQVWLQNIDLNLRYILDVTTGFAEYERPDPLPDKDTWMTFIGACPRAYDELVKSRKRFDTP